MAPSISGRFRMSYHPGRCPRLLVAPCNAHMSCSWYMPRRKPCTRRGVWSLARWPMIFYRGFSRAYFPSWVRWRTMALHLRHWAACEVRFEVPTWPMIEVQLTNTRRPNSGQGVFLDHIRHVMMLFLTTSMGGEMALRERIAFRFIILATLHDINNCFRSTRRPEDVAIAGFRIQ